MEADEMGGPGQRQIAIGPFVLTPAEAQAWANAEIAKVEAPKPGVVDYEARAKALKDMPVQEIAGFLRTIDEVGNKFQDFLARVKE